LQLERVGWRFLSVLGRARLRKREFWVGLELRDTDLLPDYGRIAARFDRIAEVARLRGDENIAERLRRHAWQIREDLRLSTLEFDPKH
jgi:hypothetical protein